MSSTSRPESPYEIFVQEPVYLVQLDGGSVRVLVLGDDPEVMGLLTLIEFEVYPSAVNGEYLFKFRTTATEQLLEIRPRPKFVLGTREDERSSSSTSKDTRWRTAYMFIDDESVEDLYKWLKRRNSTRR